jgi:hypothetical protein
MLLPRFGRSVRRLLSGHGPALSRSQTNRMWSDATESLEATYLGLAITTGKLGWASFPNRNGRNRLQAIMSDGRFDGSNSPKPTLVLIQPDQEA